MCCSVCCLLQESKHQMYLRAGDEDHDQNGILLHCFVWCSIIETGSDEYQCTMKLLHTQRSKTPYLKDVAVSDDRTGSIVGSKVRQ
jgi:hypothetical protein